jgi:tetratricopeptide (TPR) repeat protein
MAAILAAIKFWRLDQPLGPESAAHAQPAWKFYFLSLAFFLCALLSKTATIGLPAVIVLLLWWKRRASVRRDFLLLFPFFAIGIALALVTMFLEKHHLGATGPEWNFSPAQRCIIAGRALWFYLGKLLWPHPLMFMYPLWPLQTSQILSYIPLAAAIAGFLILWLKRQSPARHILFAAAYFIVMLFPILGFFNVVFYHYSFVCDHFQYLASIGPLALVAAGITFAFEQTKSLPPGIKRIAYAVLLPILFMLTWRHAGVFRDPETLWRDTLAHNPESWMAHDNLGTCLSLRGEFREAGREYVRALEIRPEDYLAWNDLGLNATRSGHLDDAISYFNQSLQFLPNYALGHYNLGNAYARKESFDDAIREFNLSLKLDPSFAPAHYSLANALARKGDTDKAIEQYKTTLQLDPDFAPAHANLGRALAGKGNLDEAITHYRAALDLDPASVEALANLANALVGQKRFDEAIRYYRAALQINPGGAIIHYNLAVALDRQGNKTEAQKELAEATRLKSLPR